MLRGPGLLPVLELHLWSGFIYSGQSAVDTYLRCTEGPQLDTPENEEAFVAQTTSSHS